MEIPGVCAPLSAGLHIVKRLAHIAPSNGGKGRIGL